MKILLFLIEGQQYALDLSHVERILWAVQYTPMPNSPEYVLGAINIHGKIIPVINLRQLLELPSKDISPSDNLILCHVKNQKVALLVDHVAVVKNCEEIIQGPQAVQCVLKNEDCITLFCDLDKLIVDPLLTMG